MSNLRSVIELKVGCKVLLCANYHKHKRFNGSFGEVTKFAKPRDLKNEVVLGELPEDPNILLPVVSFSDGMCFAVGLYMFATSSVDENKSPHATRYQVPLLLAWAVTVHRAQGLTLDNLVFDMRSSFAHGQVYVALSRARSRRSVRLTNFNVNKIFVNFPALDFYRDLESAKVLISETQGMTKGEILKAKRRATFEAYGKINPEAVAAKKAKYREGR
jgi:ATP-dependent DNA helicase PIF1